MRQRRKELLSRFRTLHRKYQSESRPPLLIPSARAHPSQEVLSQAQSEPQFSALGIRTGGFKCSVAEKVCFTMMMKYCRGPDPRQMGSEARDSPYLPSVPPSLPLIALLSSWLPVGSHKPLSLYPSSLPFVVPPSPSPLLSSFILYLPFSSQPRPPVPNSRFPMLVLLPLLPASSSRQRQAFVQAQWASAGVSLAAKKNGAKNLPPSTTSVVAAAAASPARETVRLGRPTQKVTFFLFLSLFCHRSTVF